MVSIYTLSSSSNPDLVRYVGKTTQVPKYRKTQHLYTARTKTGRRAKVLHWITKELLKGNDIILDVIDEVEDSDWRAAEIGYVKLYKGFGANLCNLTMGGDDSPITGKKENHPSFGNIGELCPAYNIHRKERIVSKKENTRKLNGLHGVQMIDIETDEVLKTFSGSEEAASFINGLSGNIRIVCQGKRQTYYGYKWKYTELPKRIFQLDENDNIINSFSTYQDACKVLKTEFNNPSNSSISRAVKTNIRAYGYYWKIIEPNDYI